MTSPSDPKPQTEFKYAIYFAKALLWAAAAAAVTAELFLQGDVDRLIVGFLAGCAFSVVMAFFDHEGKDRFGRGLFNFPRRQ
jgi:hypothetical protein